MVIILVKLAIYRFAPLLNSLLIKNYKLLRLTEYHKRHILALLLAKDLLKFSERFSYFFTMILLFMLFLEVLLNFLIPYE